MIKEGLLGTYKIFLDLNARSSFAGQFRVKYRNRFYIFSDKKLAEIFWKVQIDNIVTS